MKITTREEALQHNLVRYYTGKPCKNGHNAERFAKRRQCVECNRIAANKRVLQNPELNRIKVKNWAEKNRERAAISAHNNYLKRKAKDHKKILLAKSNWVRDNPQKVNAATAKYRATKSKRTPSWLNAVQKAEIDFTYEYCTALRQCGLDYHVDHIVPLRGKTVSGLHVPWNLQVIPCTDNLVKSNKF